MNYKISTIVLGLALILTWVFHFGDIVQKDKERINNFTQNKSGVTGGMHQMPDGSMMMNNGGSMNMMDMTMTDMVGMMKGKTGKALEKEFITGMIPHHQGAVDMAKVLLQDKTVSPELQKFAQDIITAQEGEIKMMNEWLKRY
jgi:uncharacterized protein (DUF305 family)